jgi:hypothetical protein
MISSKSYGLQNETRQYLRRLYAYGKELAGTDVNDVDNFVKGLKQLNLWGTTLCWPMRSIHNIGTGTTLLSLGGLGQYNGTLVNGPTWGINGITYDGSNDNISTTFTLGALRVFCGVVGDMPTSGGDGNFLGGVNTASPSQTIYWVNPRSSFGGEYRYGIPSTGNLTVADNTTSGVHMWTTIGGNTLNTRGYRSLTLLGTTAGVGLAPFPNQLSEGLLLGRGVGQYQGTAALSFIIHSTPATPNDFYALYKQTIGKGLGLP